MAQYMTSGGKGILARGTVVDILLIGIAVALATVVFSDRRPERLLLSTSDWDAALDGTSRIGSKDARVTVVEFVDYECPACNVAEGVLSELTSQFPWAHPTNRPSLPSYQNTPARGSGREARSLRRETRGFLKDTWAALRGETGNSRDEVGHCDCRCESRGFRCGETLSQLSGSRE